MKLTRKQELNKLIPSSANDIAATVKELPYGPGDKTSSILKQLKEKIEVMEDQIEEYSKLEE